MSTFDNATRIYQRGFCRMANRKVKKISIFIAIFFPGTFTRHFVSGLVTEFNKTTLNEAKDIISPSIVTPTNKSS